MYSREESQTCQTDIEGLGRLREQVRFARSKEKSTAFYPVHLRWILLAEHTGFGAVTRWMYSREESQTCQTDIEGLGRLREQVRFARSKEKSTAFYPVHLRWILLAEHTGFGAVTRWMYSREESQTCQTDIEGLGRLREQVRFARSKEKSTAFYPVHLRCFYWRSTQDSVQWLGEYIHGKSHKPARRASKGWADCESRFALREAKKKHSFLSCASSLILLAEHTGFEPAVPC